LRIGTVSGVAIELIAGCACRTWAAGIIDTKNRVEAKCRNEAMRTPGWQKGKLKQPGRAAAQPFTGFCPRYTSHANIALKVIARPPFHAANGHEHRGQHLYFS
jgi:hypothetical protein